MWAQQNKKIKGAEDASQWLIVLSGGLFVKKKRDELCLQEMYSREVEIICKWGAVYRQLGGTLSFSDDKHQSSSEEMSGAKQTLWKGMGVKHLAALEISVFLFVFFPPADPDI